MTELLFNTPALWLLAALLTGWLLDLLLGDPAWLPHPVVGFGKLISWGEHRLNKGRHRKAKGALLATGLIVMVFTAAWLLCRSIHLLLPSVAARGWVWVGCSSLIVFFCLAGTTLIREVRMVFLALDRSLDDGRRQVARIVGRDTTALSPQEVRTAALETLAENLSDGVIAPLFWFLLLGPAGMLAYKMVNTLDSMIGYKTERYRDFGCWAAHIDDAANYLPARLTALLMIVASPLLPKRLDAQRLPQAATAPLPRRSWRSLFRFVRKYGRQHASPNSGYPEAALAAILDCRFGGPHYYFGQLFPKPYIGHNDRQLSTHDMEIAVRVNRCAEVLFVILIACCLAALWT